jgi:hypothetical protein
MPDRLTIDIGGMFHGAAEGAFAIGALMLVALVVTRSLWWPYRDRRLDPPVSRCRGQDIEELFAERDQD